ncbi:MULTISPECIES: CopD family protein [unclassified Caballeronia]|uniref:copper resistance D family protein n=1 Tax=unclassified Caballeronia TaxID=2646786 RepID=UPI00285EA51A|nr:MULTISPECIES: CopD family protein [unclassified Caballeronia]MDR5751345.1 CopD family protein [Caballeronia sp. LZ024]MDR5844513.1 CopD family protein [Caballeronia sp. LZ031]
MNYGSLDIARLVLIALQNLAFATMVGALLGARWLKGTAPGWQVRVSAKLASVFKASAVAALVSSTFGFWVHCALMSETSLQDAWPAVRSMVIKTQFGHIWAIGTGLIFCAVAVSFIRARRLDIPAQPLMWLVIAGVALAKSNAGHPVDAGILSLPVWADWVHLLAISSWVGMVLVATFIVSPGISLARPTELSGAATFIQAMSDAATVALVALFLTGAYNGWRGVSAPENIFGSWYGLVLVFKLALVLVAAALGGHNRFFEMPALLASLRGTSSDNQARHLKRFSTVLHVESWVLIGVIAVATVLVSSPLPGTE